MPLPEAARCLRLLETIGSPPTAPFHEEGARAAVEAELDALGIARRRDRWGNVIAETRRGDAPTPLVLLAHLDHPGFEVVEARGRTARARIRGGLFRETFRPLVAIAIQRAGGVIRARGSDLRHDIELPNWSSGHLRVEAEADLAVGDWGILDLPPFEQVDDDVRMRAADDLAGCALILAVLEALRAETRPHHAYALFTRAEEPGLFGARLVAEERPFPPEAIVVDVHASRALPGAEPGRGPVVRVGDYDRTFDDRAESFLRVGAERLAALGVHAQRQLMAGGTCEAGAFLDAGYRATGIALPLRNYHNNGPDGPAPEIICLSDFRAGVALLHEAVVAAAEGAAESFRALSGRVPDAIRRLLE